MSREHMHRTTKIWDKQNVGCIKIFSTVTNTNGMAKSIFFEFLKKVTGKFVETVAI